MSTRKPGSRLGRGLSSLISAPTAADGTRRDYFLCPIESIHPMRLQPRRRFDPEALEELANSIMSSGLLQPLVVRPKDDHFVLIAGERRWRAAQMAKLDHVPVVVKDVSDAKAFELAIVENIQREDLNAIEEAEAFQRLIQEYGYTQEQLAKRVGKSRTAVTNSLRILKLSDTIQDRVADGELSGGHAKAILGAPANQRAHLAERAMTEKLSVRATEQLAKAAKQPRAATQAAPVRPGATGQLRPQLRKIQIQLMEIFGTRVEITQQANGNGRVELHFADNDGLQSILDVVLES